MKYPMIKESLWGAEGVVDLKKKLNDGNHHFRIVQ